MFYSGSGVESTRLHAHTLVLLLISWRCLQLASCYFHGGAGREKKSEFYLPGSLFCSYIKGTQTCAFSAQNVQYAHPSLPMTILRNLMCSTYCTWRARPRGQKGKRSPHLLSLQSAGAREELGPLLWELSLHTHWRIQRKPLLHGPNSIVN